MVWTSPDRTSANPGDENLLSGVDLGTFIGIGIAGLLEPISLPSPLESNIALGTAGNGSHARDGTRSRVTSGDGRPQDTVLRKCLVSMGGG